MRRADEQYRWGLLVEHNYGTRTKPGGGSCIFLHIWLGAGQGTAGCTAMESARLQEIISWLKPAARPMLLQLPETERQRVKKNTKMVYIVEKDERGQPEALYRFSVTDAKAEYLIY
jgi:hypothetical protein